jgi:hypothetical protein
MDDTVHEAALPTCPDETFDRRLSEWVKIVVDGTMTQEQLVSRLQKKCMFTDVQLDALSAAVLHASLDATASEENNPIENDEE